MNLRAIDPAVTQLPAIRHPEWAARTTGAIAYARDIFPDGMLVGRILRSPHAHARIVAIDVAAARAAPGVAAVLTDADMGGRSYRDYGQGDRPPLARGRVSFFGQEIAVVAAETEEQADAALALIKVTYEVLASATTLAEATAPDAAAVHPGRAPDNVATRADRGFGDTSAARARAPHTARALYTYGIQAHACMEPQSTVAQWHEASGVLDIWAPTQSPRNVRGEIAHMLGLEPDNVRLHRVAVGGDFGSRVKASDIEVLAGALAIAARRPVGIRLSRADEFAFNKRQHGSEIDLATGYDDEGHIAWRAADTTIENGAFIHGGSNMMNYASILMGSQYRLEGAAMRGRSIYTNRRPGGAFRGAGGPQAAFAIESQMDEIAGELGMDPIDLRLRNLNCTGDTTITGWEIVTSHAAECLMEVRERLGWDAAQAMAGSGRGVGIALAMHVSGAIVAPATGRAEAVVEIGHNGGITLFSGCADPGTGEYAVIAQLCAQELGVAAEDILIEAMDTATTPYDPGAGSSRGTMITGGAVLAASRELAEMLRGEAATRFGCDPAQILLVGGVASFGGRSVPIGELAAGHPDSAAGVLRVHRETVVETPVVPMTHEDSGVGNLSPAYSFAAHGVEVEVDRETGAVKVLRVVAAHDAGTVVNPVGAEGQVVGGVVMGLGAALGEQLLYLDGRPLVTGYGDYPMPRTTEAPPVEVVFVGGASPRGPLGAKSISEVALMPIAAAVANAVAHATGIRVRSLPITPDKIIGAGPAHRIASLWRRPDRWWSAMVRRAYPAGLFWALDRWGPRRGGGSLAPNGRRPGTIENHVFPATSRDAVAALLGRHAARPAGGATDLIVAREQGLCPATTIVALTSCQDLRACAADAEGTLVIGAATTLREAAEALRGLGQAGDLALADTIDAIATPQIREMATVAGNLCQDKRCWFYRNGFDCFKRAGAGRPCYAVVGDHRYFHAVLGAGRCQATTPADLATTLTALDATIVIEGRAGQRRVAISDFYSGPGEPNLGEGEIVHSIRIPAAARMSSVSFRKLAMTSDGFAIVSACTRLERDGQGRIAQCRIVLGGIANTPFGARRSEALVAGRLQQDVDIFEAAGAWAIDAHPLANNGWKIKAAAGVLRQSLKAALDQPYGPAG
jgi:CO/xanthine dehydrogenase Mo-binding subunit/CO/xanthine dehydrogenase FAD-binding subunit